MNPHHPPSLTCSGHPTDACRSPVSFPQIQPTIYINTPLLTERTTFYQADKGKEITILPQIKAIILILYRSRAIVA